ncbi:competence protein ComEA [Sesbania bispinosa]|nr:competence protein ComEA [Sesbania bispinosa]
MATGERHHKERGEAPRGEEVDREGGPSRREEPPREEEVDGGEVLHGGEKKREC